jgi:hypothetical protein
VTAIFRRCVSLTAFGFAVAKAGVVLRTRHEYAASMPAAGVVLVALGVRVAREER